MEQFARMIMAETGHELPVGADLQDITKAAER